MILSHTNIYGLFYTTSFKSFSLLNFVSKKHCHINWDKENHNKKYVLNQATNKIPQTILVSSAFYPCNTKSKTKTSKRKIEILTMQLLFALFTESGYSFSTRWRVSFFFLFFFFFGGGGGGWGWCVRVRERDLSPILINTWRSLNLGSSISVSEYFNNPANAVTNSGSKLSVSI